MQSGNIFKQNKASCFPVENSKCETKCKSSEADSFGRNSDLSAVFDLTQSVLPPSLRFSINYCFILSFL